MAYNPRSKEMAPRYQRVGRVTSGGVSDPSRGTVGRSLGFPAPSVSFTFPVAFARVIEDLLCMCRTPRVWRG